VVRTELVQLVGIEVQCTYGQTILCHVCPHITRYYIIEAKLEVIGHVPDGVTLCSGGPSGLRRVPAYVGRRVRCEARSTSTMCSIGSESKRGIEQ
jgi:hypothetical protein